MTKDAKALHSLATKIAKEWGLGTKVIEQDDSEARVVIYSSTGKAIAILRYKWAQAYGEHCWVLKETDSPLVEELRQDRVVEVE